jgi:hypothetical protein
VKDQLAEVEEKCKETVEEMQAEINRREETQQQLNTENDHLKQQQ